MFFVYSAILLNTGKRMIIISIYESETSEYV
jgi:hypothetical protein